MLINLIIDGNFLLHKTVFILQKSNVLYGALYESLKTQILSYKSLYPFHRVFFVSDSKEISWRKSIYEDYKSTRKKDIKIDWEFVYECYDTLKQDLIEENNCYVIESPKIEGDDWISYISNKSNKNNISCIIISNDYDIKQLVKFNSDNNTINIMMNEMKTRNKCFLPKDYKLFLQEIYNKNTDIFNLNTDYDFANYIKSLFETHDVELIDSTECLIKKILSGDTSDNLPSVYKQPLKNGRFRGIGEKTATVIYNTYNTQFPPINKITYEVIDNLAQLICEKRKVSLKDNLELITNNIKKNTKLINLDQKFLPKELLKEMDNIYNNL